MVKTFFKGFIFLSFLSLIAFIGDTVVAQTAFDPNFIISDPELQDYKSWDKNDIQNFLNQKGSYLRNAVFEDANGFVKPASDIIYEASQIYQINPKFLIVTLQKEQSLVTDDSPSQRQLDWAAGYAVCDGCYLADPKVQKYKGFGKQVDGAAGIMRWYYDNKDIKPIIKRKDTPIRIDDQPVTPGSWATAFLYTYTPHLHGNKNFWRIWNTWFEQMYPNGTLLQSASSSEYWLIENNTRRLFKNKTALITRFDPKLAIKVDDLTLQNYNPGPEIAFPNYSLLKSFSGIYLLDYDTLRPFASEDVVRFFGYNPDEIIDVEEADITGYRIGSTINASSTAPQGVIFKITDANLNYLLKDSVLYPIPDPAMIKTNFSHLPVEKHKLKELAKYQTADETIKFNDGSLIQIKDNSTVYVIENGKKRPLADDDTFIALGYKKFNVTVVSQLTAMNIPTGDRLFVNSNLLSSRTKFLGDNVSPVNDLYAKSSLPAYLVAEYPSGRIISGKNVDTRKSIASLTKIMIGYEALRQDFKLEKSGTYDNVKMASESDKLGLKTGERVRNRDMFYAMLTGSENTAARYVAQNTSLTEEELVRKINLRLEEWGADYTTIADVTGLNENNKSTARDLLKIFTRVLTDKNIKDALGTVTYNFSELRSKDKVAYHSFKNTNQIIQSIPLSKRGYKIIATKTGYTEEADSVIIMLIEAKKTKKQYIVITLGNPNYAKRFDEPHKIADWISTQKVTITNKPN